MVLANARGNASLEEVIMALRVRQDLYGLETGIDTTLLSATSRLLSRATGSVMVRNKAIVGKNAFAHESGIHQHGMLEDARTYEIMRPEDVGVEKSNLVLGKHSGRHAIAKQAKAFGVELSDAEMGPVFAAFKARADEIGEIDEWELRALLSRSNAVHVGVKLSRLGTQLHADKAELSLTLTDNTGDEQQLKATAANVFDAGLEALSAYFGVAAKIADCEITQAGFGFDNGAFAEVSLSINGTLSRGRGRGQDSVWAGIRALIDAFEKSNASAMRSHSPASSKVSAPLSPIQS